MTEESFPCCCFIWSTTAKHRENQHWRASCLLIVDSNQVDQKKPLQVDYIEHRLPITHFLLQPNVPDKFYYFSLRIQIQRAFYSSLFLSALQTQELRMLGKEIPFPQPTGSQHPLSSSQPLSLVCLVFYLALCASKLLNLGRSVVLLRLPGYPDLVVWALA